MNQKCKMSSSRKKRSFSKRAETDKIRNAATIPGMFSEHAPGHTEGDAQQACLDHNLRLARSRATMLGAICATAVLSAIGA